MQRIGNIFVESNSLTNNSTGKQQTVIAEANPTNDEYWLGFAFIFINLKNRLPIMGTNKPPHM